MQGRTAPVITHAGQRLSVEHCPAPWLRAHVAVALALFFARLHEHRVVGVETSELPALYRPYVLAAVRFWKGVRWAIK